MELKEKLLKKQREYINNKSNRSLILFLIIFFCGYGFFFSTALIFPPAFQGGLDITKIGVPREQNDRTVTLDSWIYSKEEKAMEVMIEIDNDSFKFLDKDNIEVPKSEFDEVSWAGLTKYIPKNNDIEKSIYYVWKFQPRKAL